MMKPTLAFDVYGTLIDPHGVTEALREFMGEAAAEFSNLWRTKQLEYSFRRGLMERYQNFDRCTQEALEYTCGTLGWKLSESAQAKLLDTYKALPAYPDVADGLARLQEKGCSLYAFSNGLRDSVDALLVRAGLRDYFEDIVSADEIRTFKPDPRLYAHFLHRAQSPADSTWLISSNSFDITGAVASGLKAAWIQRTPGTMFDPWEFHPTTTVSSLGELANFLSPLQP